MSNIDQAQTLNLNIPGYEIIGLIGQGGMGAVYLARQLSLGRSVAVKVLRLLPRPDPVEQIARFRREAELMAQVHHANIVPIHDSGAVEGCPYLVMEYIEGGDLRRQMEPGRPLPLDRVRPLVLPVAQALACLHAHGIVHRDLKPENILMRHGCTPMLTDFGLAVPDNHPDTATRTRTDLVMGTLGYVAPEQQYGLPVDERADEYSMAAVLYELLTGHRPLGFVKPPSQLNPELGPGVDAVLLRALEEDPDDRFPTVEEFGAALHGALASPGTEDQRLFRSRRRPSRTAGVVAAMITLAILAAVGASRIGLTLSPWERVPEGRVRAKSQRVPQQPLSPWERVPEGRVRASAPPSAEATPPSPRLTNVLDMELVLVPAGDFDMGSPDADALAKATEKPRHRVRISRPFYLGVHEVTVAEFRAFVDATGYRTEAESSGAGGSVYNNQIKGFEQVPELNWRNPGIAHTQRDDEPVVQVSWNDAVAFCQWLSGKDHRSYRLPTEAEWEYACRAGTTTRWCTGDDPAALEQVAWTQDAIHPVGGKKPNAFGLYDMHANVWEWCLDRFGHYPRERVVDPTGAPSGKARVLRGGACTSTAVDRTRSASRLRHDPSVRFHRYGFRVCCVPAEPAVAADP
jgi:formylglycine-generating enzyme required for sulfatase activity